MQQSKGKNKEVWLWLWIGIGVLVLLAIPICLTFLTKPESAAKWNIAFTGVQATGALLTVAALIAAFAQVREARKQLKDNRNWNRMSFALTLMPQIETIRQWECDLDDSVVRLIRRSEPLTPQELEAIFSPTNHKTRHQLKSFLNVLEAYCLAVNTGLADADVAKRFWGYKLICHFVELHPYIDRVRGNARDKSIYREMERVYNKWRTDIAPDSPDYGQEPE